MTPNQVPYFLSLARPGRFSSAEAIMNALPQHRADAREVPEEAHEHALLVVLGGVVPVTDS